MSRPNGILVGVQVDPAVRFSMYFSPGGVGAVIGYGESEQENDGCKYLMAGVYHGVSSWPTS